MNLAWISLVFILLSKDISTAILKIIHSLSLASAEMSEEQSPCFLRSSSLGSVSPVLWDTPLTLETTVHRIEYPDLWFFSSFTRRSYSHGEFHGLYPWGCKELDMTEQLALALSYSHSLGFFSVHAPWINLIVSVFLLNNIYSLTSLTIPMPLTVTQSLSCVCLFWDPMDCSPPGSSVHEILQVRILEWVVISSSRGSSWPRDQTHIY